ncbi:hypothetical protein [Hyphomicrobium sp. CS1BSMeth3]|uniref:helix-turn-helix transcriptional regulator n=1 Tax=Hyphomicrobium sp. CS1BSMeth3 TaxID=1892844 RepID=UPI0009309CB0|nr:hypothetical protein [Hyphomicrobium sp. CS1BSMeth3]
MTSATISELFIRAVEAIYDAAPAPEKWPMALQAIADCFGDIGTLMMWHRDDGGFGTIVSPSLIAAQKDYEENQWYLRDLPAQRLVERGYLSHSDTIVERGAITDEEMATHPYYTEFSARHGIRWRMGIAIAPDPRIVVWMALQRGPHKPPFADDERELAARLGRHVEKSLRLSIRLFDAELTNLGLGDALLRLGIGVFALDALGRVAFSNPAAQRLIGDQIHLVNGALRMGTGSQRTEIEAAVARVLKGEIGVSADTKPILLHRASSDRPLVVYLLPIRLTAHAAAQFLTHTRAIVLVIDPRTDEPADPGVVRDVLGLTLGEARVAALVCTGLKLREAADKLGIAEETARSVLKRVFSKVGVSRQSELSALLTKLVLR